MGKDISGNDRAQMNDESGKEASAEHLADESTHSDAVLNLKLAEVVAEQALSCPKIVDKNGASMLSSFKFVSPFNYVA